MSHRKNALASTLASFISGLYYIHSKNVLSVPVATCTTGQFQNRDVATPGATGSGTLAVTANSAPFARPVKCVNPNRAFERLAAAVPVAPCNAAPDFLQAMKLQAATTQSPGGGAPSAWIVFPPIEPSPSVSTPLPVFTTGGKMFIPCSDRSLSV